MNNDGRPDIIYVSLRRPNTITDPRDLSVVLSQPDGSYKTLASVPLSPNSRLDCFPVDLNADGKVDVVCSEFTQNSSNYQYYARTLLGNGDGTFQTALITPFGRGQGFMVNGAADFNHDGKTDLSVAYVDGSGSLYNEILIGDGSGRFTVSPSPSVGLVYGVTDIDKDGWPDLIQATGPLAYLNQHDGTFDYKASPGNDFYGCQFGDLDNDGNIDAICAYRSGSSVTSMSYKALRGRGDGTFDLANPIITPITFTGDQGMVIKIADLNHDGVPDLIASASNGLTVLLGKGNLQFGDATRYNFGVSSSFLYNQHLVDFADMDGDGDIDIITTGTDAVYIIDGRSDGTFELVRNSATAIPHTSFNSLDVNGDGRTDLISFSTPDLYLWQNKGDGALPSPQKLDLGSLSFDASNSAPAAISGDFDGDGKKDFIATATPDKMNYASHLLRGHGDGSFTPLKLDGTIANGGYQWSGTIVYDLNGDGRDDLIRTDQNFIYARMAQADGTFAPQIRSALTAQYISSTTAPFAIADFDHDGKSDAVVVFQDMFIHRGNGDGSFGAASAPIAIAYDSVSYKFLRDLEVADFDGDDNPDIAVLVPLSGGGSRVSIYYGDGTGGFSSPVNLTYPLQDYTKMTLSDLDGDGRADLLLSFDSTYLTSNSIAVVHALDKRAFGPVSRYVIGRNNPFLLIPADFNGDGFNDLVVGNNNTSWTLLLSDPGPVPGRMLTVQPEPSAIGQPFTLTGTLTPPAGSTTVPTGTVTFSIDRVSVGTANLSNGVASLNLSQTLPIGTHKVTAYWPGDGTYASIIFSATHKVTTIPVSITFDGTPSSITVGRSVPVTFKFTNGVNSPAFPPTGSYTVMDGGTQIASGTVATTATSTVINQIPLSAGTHTYTVNYSGDSNHATSVAAFTVTVNPATTTTVLRSSANPAVYGQSITLTATITPSISAEVPALLSSGSSTLTLTGLPGGPVALPVIFPAGAPANTPMVVSYSPGGTLLPGSYTLNASFSGNLNLLSSSSSMAQVVSPPPSSTTLTLTPAPSYANRPLTINVGVSGVITTPTGTVQIIDGSTALAAVPVVNGVAAYSTKTLSAGTHNLSATYGGDPNNASSSATLAAAVLPYDFTVAASPNSVSLSRSGSGSVTITATSVGGFAENVSFAVTGQPSSFTGTFAPSSLTLTAGGTGTVTLNLAGNSRAEVTWPHRLASLTKVSLAILLLPLIRRRRTVGLLTVMLCLSFLLSATGCSGGTSGPESYTLVVTATSTDSSISHSVSVPLTVTK
jgi:hypothetical protein